MGSTFSSRFGSKSTSSCVYYGRALIRNGGNDLFSAIRRSAFSNSGQVSITGRVHVPFATIVSSSGDLQESRSRKIILEKFDKKN